jgi:lipopolysaccharide export LptBFGC system permease protein LptF
LAFENSKKIEKNLFINRKANSEITITNSGLWFRDAYDNASYIIYAKTYDKKINGFANVRFFKFQNGFNLQNLTYGKSATIKNNLWFISDAEIIETIGHTKRNVLVKIPTKLSIKNINKMTTDPKSISLWGLKKYIKMLERVGLSTIYCQMQLYSRFATIVQMLAFGLCATMFCVPYNNRSNKKYITNIASVLLTAFSWYFLNNLLVAFGANGTLPIAMSIFFMPCLSLAIFLIFIRRSDHI